MTVPEFLPMEDGAVPLYEGEVLLSVATAAGLRWLDCDETAVPLLTVPDEPLLMVPAVGFATLPAGLAATLSVLVEGVVLTAVVLLTLDLPDEGVLVTDEAVLLPVLSFLLTVLLLPMPPLSEDVLPNTLSDPV